MAEAAGEWDTAFLLDMLLAARDARAFLNGMDEASFMASRLHQNAVARSLEIIGEAAGRVSRTLQDAHPETPWRDIVGMRNRLIHGYADVRLDVVWSVADIQLEALISALQPMIPDEADGAD